MISDNVFGLLFGCVVGYCFLVHLLDCTLAMTNQSHISQYGPLNCVINSFWPANCVRGIYSHHSVLPCSFCIGQGPVSRKSRNLSGFFRVSQFSLYFVSSFRFLLSSKHVKRPAYQNERMAVS